ncbi:MAG: hypothetical protein MAG431_01642 [Chloroflexi bacterium]|nr:hypothetical protein [Chloroflexota bacterium]
MGNKGHPPRLGNSVHQSLRVISFVYQFSLGSKNQKMIFLIGKGAVVNLFPGQKQDAVLILSVISFYPLNQKVMIGDDDHVQACFLSSLGNFSVGICAIRIRGMNVQIYTKFWHILVTLCSA